MDNEQQSAERIADVLTDPEWVVCNCVYECGYADPDCPHCDGQGGWSVEEDDDP